MLRSCLHVTFLKNDLLLFNIVSMNNGQNGLQSILSIIQPVTIDTMLNNNGPF